MAAQRNLLEPRRARAERHQHSAAAFQIVLDRRDARARENAHVGYDEGGVIRERALANTTGFYGWMFCGERIYHALAPAYPLLRGEAEGPVCFETFPHAITCALLGRDVASAKQKKAQRRKLLEDAGIATAALKSIDAIDAALCALTARYYLQGQTRAFGDEASGYILVPAPRSQSPSCPAHAESA